MTISELFEEIKNVPWNAIRSLSGFSEHIPACLDSLISNSTSLSDKAYWRLDSEVVEQGYLYPTAFYIIPFLMELLAIREKEGLQYQSCFYDLIIEIAFGCSGIEDVVTYKEVKKGRFIYYIPDKDGIKIPLQIGCRSIVARYLLVLFNELKNNNNQKLLILDIISFFEEYKDTVLSGLEDFKYNYSKEIEHNLSEYIDETIKRLRSL